MTNEQYLNIRQIIKGNPEELYRYIMYETIPELYNDKDLIITALLKLIKPNPNNIYIPRFKLDRILRELDYQDVDWSELETIRKYIPND